MRLITAFLLAGTACAGLVTSVSAQQAAAPASGDVPTATLKPGTPAKTAPAPKVGPFSLETRSASPAASSAASRPVDETALRYYASQNDVARVSAEIRRLRSLNPTWEPPANLLESAAQPQDEQPLWDLYAAGALDELAARIAQKQADEPAWQPSSDLSEKLRLALGRRDLVSASDAEDWGAVLTAAAQVEKILTCSDVDALWRVAEALARTGDVPGALSAYRYLVTNCPAPAERLATVQKASLVLTQRELDALLALGKRNADGTGEFDAVRLDVVRRKMAAAIASLQGSGSADAEQPTAAEIEGFAKLARRVKSRGDIELLGWYYYAAKKWPEAEAQFRTSMDLGASGKAAEGLALTQRSAGKLAEAEDTAWSNRALDPLVRKAFIEIVSAQLTASPRPAVTPERLTRLAGLVDSEKSALGAQSLGWYAYNGGEFQQALGWFKKSVEWGPSEEGVVGLAVAAQRLKDTAQLRSVMAAYKATYPRLAELDRPEKPAAVARVAAARKPAGQGSAAPAAPPPEPEAAKQLTNEAVLLFKMDKYAEALDTLDRRRDLAPEPRGLQILRGWALLKSGNEAAAKRLFTALDDADSTPESREGLRVIEQKEYNKYMVHFR